MDIPIAQLATAGDDAVGHGKRQALIEQYADHRDPFADLGGVRSISSAWMGTASTIINNARSLAASERTTVAGYSPRFVITNTLLLPAMTCSLVMT